MMEAVLDRTDDMQISLSLPETVRDTMERKGPYLMTACSTWHTPYNSYVTTHEAFPWVTPDTVFPIHILKSVQE